MSDKKTKVVIAMGSKTDLPTMKEAAEALKRFEIPYRLQILSAHRTPHEVAQFAESARSEGVLVIIAGAGGAAHLPGMIASYTEVPVIGVPVQIGPLEGKDALLSIVQMPKGVPVATVAIGNAWNAGVLAAQIIGSHPSSEAQKILDKILEYKKELRQNVIKNSTIEEEKS